MSTSRKLRRSLKPSKRRAKKSKPAPMSTKHQARENHKAPFWRTFRFWVGAFTVLGAIGTILGLFVCREGKHIERNVASHGQEGGVTAQTHSDSSVTSNDQIGGITAHNVTAGKITINNYFAHRPPDEMEALQQALTARYPLGYAVLATDGKNVHIPEGLSFEKHLVVKWENATVEELKPDRVGVQLPDFLVKKTLNTFAGCGIGVDRKVGSTSALDLGEIGMTAEMLKDEGDFVVLAIGFQASDSGQSQDPRKGDDRSQQSP